MGPGRVQLAGRSTRRPWHVRRPSGRGVVGSRSSGSRSGPRAPAVGARAPPRSAGEERPVPRPPGRGRGPGSVRRAYPHHGRAVGAGARAGESPQQPPGLTGSHEEDPQVQRDPPRPPAGRAARERATSSAEAARTTPRHRAKRSPRRALGTWRPLGVQARRSRQACTNSMQTHTAMVRTPTRTTLPTRKGTVMPPVSQAITTDLQGPRLMGTGDGPRWRRGPGAGSVACHRSAPGGRWRAGRPDS